MTELPRAARRADKGTLRTGAAEQQFGQPDSAMTTGGLQLADTVGECMTGKTVAKEAVGDPVRAWCIYFVSVEVIFLVFHFFRTKQTKKKNGMTCFLGMMVENIWWFQRTNRVAYRVLNFQWSSQLAHLMHQQVLNKVATSRRPWPDIWQL